MGIYKCSGFFVLKVRVALATDFLANICQLNVSGSLTYNHALIESTQRPILYRNAFLLGQNCPLHGARSGDVHECGSYQGSKLPLL